MNTIPSEICNIIFQNLETSDISQCRRVCKSWHPQANELFWKQVTIYPTRTRRIRKYILEEDVNQYFKHGHLIRKLTFVPPSSHYRQQLKGREVMQFLKYFPKVEEIRVANELCPEYLGCFLHSDLKCLKKITNLAETELSDFISYGVYIDICLKHKDTMTSIDFKHKPSISIKDNRIVGFPDITNPFKNLTELTLRHKSDPNLITINVQVACPNLSVFHYYSDFPINDTIVEKQMKKLKDTEMYHINRNINNLYLKHTNFPINYVKYLTKYLPDKMEKIHLILLKTNLFNWIDEIGEETALKFMEKLRTVKIVDVTFVDMDGNIEFDYSDTNVSKMTKYFKLANALRGNRKPYCTFKTSGTFIFNNSFSYNANEELHLTYGLNMTYDFIQSDASILNDDPHYIGFNSPDTTISGIGFEIVDKMEFRYEDGPDSTIPYLLFDYFSKSCPNMIELKINDDYFPRLVIKAASQQFKSLKSGEKGFDSITLTNIGRLQEIVNTLTTYSPNITEIVCEYILFRNYCDRCDTDLSSLTKLQKFTFDLDLNLINLQKTDYLIITLKYTDGDEKQFCYNKLLHKTTILGENFNSGTNITDTITFKCDKKLNIVLRVKCAYIVGVFVKGELLNVDYPIEAYTFCFLE